MNVVVDAIAFQLQRPIIPMFWQALLQRLAQQDDVDLIVLDRGGLPNIEGGRTIPFPSFKPAYTPADSKMIQRICDMIQADVFISTDCTTPLTTPSIAIVRESAFDRGRFDTERHWQEMRLVLRHAVHHLCLSDAAARSLDMELSDASSVVKVNVEPPLNLVGIKQQTLATLEPVPVNDDLIEPIVKIMHQVVVENRNRTYQSFYDTWKKLRTIQSEVDV